MNKEALLKIYHEKLSMDLQNVRDELNKPPRVDEMGNPSMLNLDKLRNWLDDIIYELDKVRK